MERIVLCLAFLLTASLAQQDMDSNVFLFPKATATAHVILQPSLTKSLDKFTFCLRSYTELTKDFSLFSVASEPGGDNSILIYVNSPNSWSVYINQEENTIQKDTDVLDWKHTCVTWDSDTGVTQLWVNGKLYPRRVSKKGTSISSRMSIILGQEQDSFGGDFDIKQSFVGEISDVHMWDYVLSPKDIWQALFNNKDINGNMINWRSLKYEIKGNVLVQPKLQCKSHEFIYSSYSQCYEENKSTN